MTTNVTLDKLQSLTGITLPPSPWISIDQQRIDRFAVAADDDQWIHTDPERAASGPFGTTIAHGYLTLSLVIPLFEQTLQIEGATTKVNYGLNKVRFTSPVPVGSRIRLQVKPKEVTDLGKGAYQICFDAVVEIEGGERPACVAEPVFRYYP